MLKRMIFSGLLLAMLLTLTQCAQIADQVVSGAVSGLGRAAAEHAEQVVYQKLAPKEKLPPPATPGWGSFMAIQAQVVFSYSFTPGGMDPGQRDYQPGEWTRFRFSDRDDAEDVVYMERAFLKKLDDGREWWRVTWSEGEDIWIYEGLFNAGQTELIRLRARDVDGNEGEVPVTGGSIFIQPAELTEESVQGATVRQEKISTEAGEFKTTVVQYLSMNGDGELTWWLTEQVPGGIVKYQAKDKGDQLLWTCELVESGVGTTTMLNSY